MFYLFLGYIYLHVFLYIVRSTMEIRWSLSDFLLVSTSFFKRYDVL